MGTGQTLLTIMAMMMLGRLVLSVNAATAESGGSIEMSAYRITGTSLGTSILEEASGVAYDEATVASDINSTSLLSTTIGPESGEVYPDYDDYDDFNGLARVDSLQSSAVFTTRVKVDYVSISGGAIVVSATPTYNKRITVAVSSPSMIDTLKFYDVYSYWYFR